MADDESTAGSTAAVAGTPVKSGTEAEGPKPLIKSTDMSDDMQAVVFQVANEALSKYKVEKDVAVFIKEEFDRKYGTSWHCVVGRNFGSFVSHESNCFIYFYLNNVAIMLYKTAF